MESLIGEFPKIGNFPILCSPDKKGKNCPALRTNSEIFQGEPLRGEFVENVWKRAMHGILVLEITLTCQIYKFNLMPCPFMVLIYGKALSC